MRTRFGTVLTAAIALVIGGVAGWFAAGAWCGAAVSSKPPYRGEASLECNAGRARRPATADTAAKSRRKALIRSSADAEVQKRILENKISYLEKCIAAAKGSPSKPDGSGASADGRAGASNGRAGSPLPAEKKRETNSEIIERLMKLPTENERWTALNRLDRKTNMSFTLGEMKRLCPEHTELALSAPPDWLDKATEVAARRIGILEAFDPSGLNDEERKVHTEFMEFLAEIPNVFVNLIDQNDSMTMGEVWEHIQNGVATLKRGAELVKKEREMLVTQTVKGFGITEGDAAELRATLDEVRDATRFMYFEEK